MKRSIFVLFIAAAIMAFFSCSDNQPTSPDLSQNDQVTTHLAKRDTTQFTGSAAIDCPTWLPGKIDILPNGKTLIKGHTVRYDMLTTDPLVAGASLWNVNKKVNAGAVVAKIWGKIDLFVGVEEGNYDYENAVGKWDISFHGRKIGKNVLLEAKE